MASRPTHSQGHQAEILDKMGAFAAAGAQRFYLQVLDLSDMDHLRLVAEEILPHAPGPSVLRPAPLFGGSLGLVDLIGEGRERA